jgi:Protein of unknown function (DUF642)
MPARLTAALAALLAAPALAQNLVSNPSFETPDAGCCSTVRFGQAAMGPWNVDNNVDQVGGDWQAAQGLQSVDLNGNSAGAVWQTLATTPGAHYRIRYALSENFGGTSDKTMDVYWAGAIIHSDTVVHDFSRTATDMRWNYIQLSAVAPGPSTVLKFESTTGFMYDMNGTFATYWGPALDDVSVTPGGGCGSADFDCDGDTATDADIEAFFRCLAGTCPPPPCTSTADFNSDGDSATDADIEAFFRVLAGGNC